MIVLDVGPPQDSAEYPRWLTENRGPVRVHIDDATGAEWLARNPLRFLRQGPDGHWGRLDAHGGFTPSGIEAVDPEPTHARGTVIGEQIARERREGLRD
jgi:hypothetical protein